MSLNNNIIYSKPSAIIFDFDDTLVNTKPIINKALSATFSEFNIDKNSLSHIDFNLSLRDFFHDIFADNIEKARETYYKYYSEFSQNLMALDHAELVLKFLQKHQVFTSIVSNKTGDRLRHELTTKLMWDHYFSNIIGSGDAASDKPSPLPAILSLTNSGLDDYSNVWLIGDSNVDIKTAANLGCKALLFGNNLKHNDLPIYLSVSNHLELLKILEKIYGF